MIPWQLLASARLLREEGELTLHLRGEEFSIRAGGRELMNSRRHGSEELLAELTCARVADRPAAHVLVGGLGIGFTLAAALARLGPRARVTVAELAPAVVAWNRTHLGHLAGHPLSDARVTVREADVARLIRTERGAYDAIVLDVDNGPKGLTRRGNDWLYQRAGLERTRGALRASGVLAVWSAGTDSGFVGRLTRAGFTVEERTVRARAGKGARHTIWLATRAAER